MRHANLLTWLLIAWPLSATAQLDPASSADRSRIEFEQAARRVGSPDYAHRIWEAQRRREIDRQVNLQSQVLWRSGFASPQAPVSPLAATAGGVSPPIHEWPGSPDIYSPYYFGPFEPTPFWPGYIWGYPYVPFVDQPIGYRITPDDGNIADGYVYEPVYADDPAVGQDEVLAQQQPFDAAHDPDLQRFAEMDDLEVALEPATLAFRAGDYRLAVAHLIRLPDAVRTSGPAEMLRAYALFALGNNRAASLALYAALSQLPYTHWQSEADLAAERFAAPARYDAHLQQLEARVRQQPNDAAARFVLGAHYGFRGFPRDAVRQLQFALDLGIEFPDPSTATPDDEFAPAVLDYFQARLPRREPPEVPAGPQAF